MLSEDHWVHTVRASLQTRMKREPFPQRDTDWSVGRCCIAMFPADKKWYRGVVVRISGVPFSFGNNVRCGFGLGLIWCLLIKSFKSNNVFVGKYPCASFGSGFCEQHIEKLQRSIRWLRQYWGVYVQRHETSDGVSGDSYSLLTISNARIQFGRCFHTVISTKIF